MTTITYSATSQDPSTPAEFYAKAVFEAMEDPAISTAFISAKEANAGVGILEMAIETKLPKTKAGTDAKAVLSNLRELHAAIPDEAEVA